MHVISKLNRSVLDITLYAFKLAYLEVFVYFEDIEAFGPSKMVNKLIAYSTFQIKSNLKPNNDQIYFHVPNISNEIWQCNLTDNDKI